MVLGSKLVSGSKVGSDFILLRLKKLVAGIPGDLKIKSELCPCSGFVFLKQLNPIYKKGA